jgi:peptide/nickel transport system permease protein
MERTKHWTHQIALRLLGLVFVALLGGLLSATLVRIAPGYGVDERELNPQLSQATLESIRSANHADANLLVYYARFLNGLLHGNLGTSQWLQRPIAPLIRERLPVTLRSALFGTALAWIAALCAALGLCLFRSFALDVSGTLVTGLLIAIPTAVIASFLMQIGIPVALGIAIVLFPKLFRYLRNLLIQVQAQPHILAAQARGVSEGRILSHHVLPCVSPALLALLGVSLSMGFGAAIPMEALCDSPGIGQLAWQAALNRDMPLVMNLTLLVTLITVAANWLANPGERRVI